MWQIVGIFGVFAAIGTGYTLAGGKFAVILQSVGPELLTILGSGLMTVLISNEVATIRKIIVGIRPENLGDALLVPATAPGTTLEADVELVEALGSELQIHFLTDATAARSADTDLAKGRTSELDEVAALPMTGSKSEGVARVSPRSTIRPGSRATFVVDTDSLHFFDPDTGLAIWS